MSGRVPFTPIDQEELDRINGDTTPLGDRLRGLLRMVLACPRDRAATTFAMCVLDEWRQANPKPITTEGKEP